MAETTASSLGKARRRGPPSVSGGLAAAGFIAPLLLVGAATLGLFVSRAEEPAGAVSRVTVPRGALVYDSLRNTSRLSDEELRYYFEWLRKAELPGVLDQDGDGTADGTMVPVMEFIGRMEIILNGQAPFVDRVIPQGMPVVRTTDL